MGVGIAFVEFLDAEVCSTTLQTIRHLTLYQHAGKLLAATMSPELHPEGFRILNKPVATSFANPGSFQPLAPHSLRDEACIMGSLAMGGTEGVFAKYWDETTTILEMTFDVSQLSKQKESAAQGDKKKKRKLRQDEASMFLSTYFGHSSNRTLLLVIPVDINEFMSSAIAPEVKAPTALPTNLKPIILNINKSGSSGIQLKLAGWH
jgi:RNA-binding protein 5/10